MNTYTHYSLFMDYKTVADFAPVPAGGLPGLLADFHRLTAKRPTYCVGGKLCLHPGGEQFSMEEKGVCLILMTRGTVAGHARELAAEGNEQAACAAKEALL